MIKKIINYFLKPKCHYGHFCPYCIHSEVIEETENIIVIGCKIKAGEQE